MEKVPPPALIVPKSSLLPLTFILIALAPESLRHCFGTETLP